MDDLDSLLTESLSIVAEGKAAADARKRMKQVHGVTAAERKEDAERIAAWESQHVWRPEANVARFVEQECACCRDTQYIFEGLMQRQSHRHLKDGSKRWIPVDKQIPALPNEIQMVHREVPFCLECCELAGFDLRNAAWESGAKVEWEVYDEATQEIAHVNAGAEPPTFVDEELVEDSGFAPLADPVQPGALQ